MVNDDGGVHGGARAADAGLVAADGDGDGAGGEELAVLVELCAYDCEESSGKARGEGGRNTHCLLL